MFDFLITQWRWGIKKWLVISRSLSYLDVFINRYLGQKTPPFPKQVILQKHATYSNNIVRLFCFFTPSPCYWLTLYIALSKLLIHFIHFRRQKARHRNGTRDVRPASRVCWTPKRVHKRWELDHSPDHGEVSPLLQGHLQEPLPYGYRKGRYRISMVFFIARFEHQL